MTNEIYLEELLTQKNNYSKVNSVYSKDDYFLIELDHISLTASIKIAIDNAPIRLYVENWKRLKQDTLKDLLSTSLFIS